MADTPLTIDRATLRALIEGILRDMGLVDASAPKPKREIPPPTAPILETGGFGSAGRPGLVVKPASTVGSGGRAITMSGPLRPLEDHSAKIITLPQIKGRRFIGEDTLRNVPPGATLVVPGEFLLSPLASDLIRDRHITLRTTSRGSDDEVTARVEPTKAAFTGAIVIASDHRGREVKDTLVTALKADGWAVEDLSPTGETVDYPAHSIAVAERVVGRGGVGVLIDGAGLGACIAANKVRGARAAVANDVRLATYARQHNDANVLCLGATFTDPSAALNIVRTFLRTPFEGGRHADRLAAITRYEQR